MTAATDTDSTTARRDLLLMLLSRFERGVITDAERPLLRPLVEAEMATLDQVDGVTRVLAIPERDSNPELTTDPYADGWNDLLAEVHDALGGPHTCPDDEPCPIPGHDEPAGTTP